MTHAIPSSFRLRRRKWLVKRRPVSPSGTHAGLCTPPPPKSIVIYDMARNKARTPGQQQKTFWHESTHAMLMTMGHKLARDEAFVTQFSLLLEELIRTARFEENA
jgi:hypothetical protein